MNKLYPFVNLDSESKCHIYKTPELLIYKRGAVKQVCVCVLESTSVL